MKPKPMPGNSPLRRRVRRAFAGASVAAGLYALVTVGAAYVFLHPPRTAVASTPASLNLRFEEVRFPSATDGLQLRGWYLPAQGKPRGVILFCHGRQGNRAGVLTHARYLHKAGYALFSFDFRACGDSEGDMSTIGWREVGDAQGAVSYLQSRSDTRRVPLGIFGASMGAAVAIQIAAKTPEIQCVVADSAYATLDRAVDQRFRGVFPNGSTALSVPIQFVGEQMMGCATATVSPLAEIPKLASRPVFFIHGLEDRLIQAEDSRILYAAATGPKELWLVPGAGHVGAYKAARDEYQKRVTHFFNGSFGAAK
ncbi:MAG: alpha/beta fold hydrolase [Armatimonadota bacterium]